MKVMEKAIKKNQEQVNEYFNHIFSRDKNRNLLTAEDIKKLNEIVDQPMNGV